MRKKVFFTVFLVYLFYIAPDYLTANSNRYIDLTKAIVDDRTFVIDKYYQNTRDWGVYDGHRYMGAAPGLGFMAVPIYVALKPLLGIIASGAYSALEFNILKLFFSFFLSLLPGAAITALLYNILKKFDLKEKERLLITFGTAFGTLLFYYSTRFMAHSMGTFLLFAPFCMFFNKRHGVEFKHYHFFLAGLSLGLAVLTDYILAAGAALIILYGFFNFRRRDIAGFILLLTGVFLTAIVYMYYHYKCFDNPFATAARYSQMIGPNAFSWPKPKIMLELSFGAYRGLFIYMPVTLLGLYGIFGFFRHPEKKYIPDMILITLFSVFIFLLISGFVAWDGGGDFGPRYFISFIPFLMTGAAFVFRRLSYKIALWIASLSIFINWCGVQYGDADNAFTDVGLFLFMGLKSNMADWAFKITNAYIRKMNVVTHFSPIVPFALLVFVLYLIWRRRPA